MQKFLALLMLVTVLLSLSACGDRPDTAAEQFPPTVYDGTGGNGSPAPGGDPAGEPLTPSERLWDGDNDGASDVPVTPYDEMVENGRIRDTDGILSDGENPQN